MTYSNIKNTPPNFEQESKILTDMGYKREEDRLFFNFFHNEELIGKYSKKYQRWEIVKKTLSERKEQVLDLSKIFVDKDYTPSPHALVVGMMMAYALLPISLSK